MNETEKTSFAERLKTAAEARRAMLARFAPRPAANDPLLAQRAAAKTAEQKGARAARADAKHAARQTQAAADAAAGGNRGAGRRRGA